MTADILGAWINVLAAVAAAVSGIVSFMVVSKINRDSRQTAEDAHVEDRARQEALVAEILALKAEMKAVRKPTGARTRKTGSPTSPKSRNAEAA